MSVLSVLKRSFIDVSTRNLSFFSYRGKNEFQPESFWLKNLTRCTTAYKVFYSDGHYTVNKDCGVIDGFQNELISVEVKNDINCTKDFIVIKTQLMDPELEPEKIDWSGSNCKETKINCLVSWVDVDEFDQNSYGDCKKDPADFSSKAFLELKVTAVEESVPAEIMFDNTIQRSIQMADDLDNVGGCHNDKIQTTSGKILIKETIPAVDMLANRPSVLDNLLETAGGYFVAFIQLVVMLCVVYYFIAKIDDDDEDVYDALQPAQNVANIDFWAYFVD